MLLVVLALFISQSDSVSLRSHIQSSKNVFVMKAISDNRVILLEKESTTLFSIQFNEKKIESFSYDIIIDPIADLLISYDKTIQIITQYNPVIVRFDRLLNVLDVHRLPNSINEANSFYELKTGDYLILSQPQKSLFLYNKRQQQVVETIRSGTYASLQFASPNQILLLNNNLLITDGVKQHKFNLIPNYIGSEKALKPLINTEQLSKQQFILYQNGDLFLNSTKVTSSILAATLSTKYIFFLNQSMDLKRFEIH